MTRKAKGRLLRRKQDRIMLNMSRTQWIRSTSILMKLNPMPQPKGNDTTIGSYNHYHVRPNGIPSCNQRWYGLLYLVYTGLVNLGLKPME